MKKPQELSQQEIKEVCQIDFIRESWGARDAHEMEQVFDESIYAVKFDFFSGSPGYVGDLCILRGDALTGDAPATVIRDRQVKRVSAY